MSGDDKTSKKPLPAPHQELPRDIAAAGLSDRSAELVREGAHAYHTGDQNKATVALAGASLSIMSDLTLHGLKGMLSGGEDAPAHSAPKYTPIPDSPAEEIASKKITAKRI